MNEMISIIDDAAILDPAVSERIALFEAEVKAIKKREDELKAAIIAEMEQKGIIKVETDELVISYIAATDREYFDAKQFRANNPEQYDDYVTMKPVKASIRIRLK